MSPISKVPKRIDAIEAVHGDEDTRVYSLTAEIVPDASIRNWTAIDKSLPFTQAGSLVVGALLAVSGIDIWINRYAVFVMKGDAFDWRDVEPDIIRALRLAYPGDPAEIELRGKFALDMYRVAEILREKQEASTTPAEIPIAILSETAPPNRTVPHR